MVQFFKGSADPRDAAYGKLAEALGGGIGNGLNTYFANKSLDSVLQDKALQDAPLSKKMAALQKAAAPYGQNGQMQLQQKLQTAQQEYTEKETAKQEALQKKKSKALNKYLKNEPLTDEEETMFTPNEWVDMYKARNPKPEAPTGGLSGVPLTAEESKLIKKTIQDNPNATASELELALGETGIVPGRYSNIIESKRREEENKHKYYIDDRDYHTKVSRPIIEEAQQTLKNSSIEKGIEEQLRRDISSGNTSGLFPFMVDKLGMEAWRNPESARLTNEVKNLFIGALKEIPGAKPNQFIERFLSTAQPMIGRSPEANLSVLDVADFVRDVRVEHAKFVLEMAREDRKKFDYAKEDISERAWNKMGDFVNRRQEKMAIDIRERHEKDLSTADLMSEVLNGTVPPNTPLTPKMMKIFYIKNNKNIDAAIAEAKKSNFVLPEYLE